MQIHIGPGARGARGAPGPSLLCFWKAPPAVRKHVASRHRHWHPGGVPSNGAGVETEHCRHLCKHLWTMMLPEIWTTHTLASSSKVSRAKEGQLYRVQNKMEELSVDVKCSI